MSNNNQNPFDDPWSMDPSSTEMSQPQPEAQFQPTPFQQAPHAYGDAAPPQQQYAKGSAVLTTVIAILAVVLVALGGTILYLTTKDSGTTTVASEQSSVGGQTSTVVQTEIRETQTQVQQAPANDGSSLGSSAPLAGGTLSTAWPGTSVTTVPFTENVRQAYVRYRNSTGAESGTISAYSPRTKLTYSMWCRPSGVNIKCTGGNNAVVYIGG